MDTYCIVLLAVAAEPCPPPPPPAFGKPEIIKALQERNVLVGVVVRALVRLHQVLTEQVRRNPYSVILSSKFYEVQKYVSATNHVYATNPIQISKRFWDKLSPAEQKLIQEAATEAQNYQRVVSREASGKAVSELQAKAILEMQLQRLTGLERQKILDELATKRTKAAAIALPVLATPDLAMACTVATDI